MLQRFMPRKQASAWLDNDRKFDPTLPFFYLHGDVVYQSRDLEQFVRRCLTPRARVEFSERRTRSDRRHAGDRRRNPEVRLSPLAERRQVYSHDRRAMMTRDWRAAANRA